MSGRLKKRGLDRDTVAIDRALQGITQLEGQVGALGTSIGSNKSFDYDEVEVDHAAGGVEDSVHPVSGTQAVISECDELRRVVSWSISAGSLSVRSSDPVFIRFLVF